MEEEEGESQSSFLTTESLVAMLEEISFVAGEAVELFFAEDPFDSGTMNFDAIAQYV